MESIKIIATGRALPKKIVSNDALCETVDSSDEWIRTRTGILQRYCCEGETCLDLAEAAAQKALEKAGIDRDQIGGDPLAIFSLTDHPYFKLITGRYLIRHNTGPVPDQSANLLRLQIRIKCCHPDRVVPIGAELKRCLQVTGCPRNYVAKITARSPRQLLAGYSKS